MVSQSLSNGKAIPSPDAPGVGRLTMDRHRIVSGCADPTAQEGLLKGRASVALQHEEMHRVRGACNDRWCCQLCTVDGLAISRGDCTPVFVSSVQVREFDSEDCRLKFIQA